MEATDQSPMDQLPPLQPDQEWANALTHGIATAAAVVGTVALTNMAYRQEAATGLACFVYGLSVCGTFAASTLSHAIHKQPWLNILRAWDQGLIYAMISGTYTPFVVGYAPSGVKEPLLIAIWIAAFCGFVGKVFIQHRVNAIGTISYLLLGWLPAMPLIPHVPSHVGWAMATGGVLYTIGVVFLMNDLRVRYFHALWHVTVLLAAAVHYVTIWQFVAAG